MTITIKEALEQGYTRCGYEGLDFQTLKKIETLEQSDFDASLHWGKLCVADKEPSWTPSISAQDLAELLADHLLDLHNERVNDDTDEVADIVKALDFTATSEMINKALESKKYFDVMEDMELIPNP